ncbi:unnamed protein product, partial [Mesorhabditis belari]|uniref:Uncharacterized protein n=1 Tax=Mesorhabditis belari TaxID=2138241 RepID=A0AAF3J813_9BILA
MLKISSLQYFLLLFYASLTVTHRVAYNGVLFHESSDATIVSDEYIYVPIGHSVELPCVAREKTHQMHIDYKKADWRYYTRYGRKMTSSYGIRYDKRIDRFHFNDTTSFLSARFLQAIHNNTMLECWIPIGYQEPVRYVVSRFRIIIQDCGVEDNVFLNLMNPCAFW